MDITLNFINQCNDARRHTIVLFQRNAASPAERTIAWRVIERCGYGHSHPMIYSRQLQVATMDSWGNQKPAIPASVGQRFILARTPAGEELAAAGGASHPLHIEVENRLQQSAVCVCVYRSGFLLGTDPKLAPGQSASFRFNDSIVIGAVPRVVEAQILRQRHLSEFYTELSLFGVSSYADIIMTGGGYGPGATAYRFTLFNVE